LQDRLVKELRLAGVRTLAEGNTLLPAFMADYNARFAKSVIPLYHSPVQQGGLQERCTWKAFSNGHYRRDCSDFGGFE